MLRGGTSRPLRVLHQRQRMEAGGSNSLQIPTPPATFSAGLCQALTMGGRLPSHHDGEGLSAGLCHSLDLQEPEGFTAPLSRRTSNLFPPYPVPEFGAITWGVEVRSSVPNDRAGIVKAIQLCR